MQSEKLANHHQKMHDKIHSDCASRLREWKKGAYHTKLMGGYKEVDQLNTDFKKAQKNWLKMEDRVEQQKMRYHRVCHELQQNETRAKQGGGLVYRFFSSDLPIKWPNKVKNRNKTP